MVMIALFCTELLVILRGGIIFAITKQPPVFMKQMAEGFVSRMEFTVLLLMEMLISGTLYMTFAIFG